MIRQRDAPDLGEAWELRAAEFLSRQGISVITRRYRCRLGELDIVARDGEQLLIVEVRARARSASAIETIGPRKRHRIVNATRHFLMRNRDWHLRPIRFDVIAIDEIDTEEPKLRWIRNAFDAS